MTINPVLDCRSFTKKYWSDLFLLQDSGHILLQKPVTVLYPKISSQAVIECDCVNISCKSVLWFRSTRSVGNLQFLGTCNNANRFTHGAGVAKERFQFDKRGTSSFVLRIANVMEEDGGIYSCVLKDMGPTHVWNPGSVLRPGGLYAELSSASFTAVQYQVFNTKWLWASGGISDSQQVAKMQSWN